MSEALPIIDPSLLIFIIVGSVALFLTLLLICITGSHKRKLRHDTKEFEFERYDKKDSINFG
ncbi:MAG: hypothetical protein ACTSVZ_10375 [Promethearchaeota archaeon]